MSLHHIEDFGLTAHQLECKYEKRGYHPGYWTSQWVRAVNLDGTLDGYWQWVYNKIMDEQEALEADSPYQ